MSLRWIAISSAVAVAGVLAAGATAGAATRYAGPTGTGAEPCADSSNPCEIGDAVSGGTVMPGDEVILLPGSYALIGGLNIGESISVGPQPGAPRPLITTPDGIAINNPGSATPPTLRDVQVMHTGAGVGLGNLGGLVERVSVTSSSPAGTACNISQDSGIEGLLRDSVCVQTAGGPAVGVSWGGPLSSGSKLVNVTALSTAAGGVGVSLHATSNGAAMITAVNTIARGALTDIRASDDGSAGAVATVALSNSNYATETEPGPSSVTDPGTGGNQTAAPLFVNAAAGDVHQLATSPTVDAGATDPLLGALDFEGQARTLGSAPDIGADELTPPAPTAKKKCKKKKRKKGKGKTSAKKKKKCKKRGKRKKK